VIERIGQIPKAEDHLKLVLLAQCGNEGIREAIRRVFISSHPQNWDVLGAWERLGRSPVADS
jgi:hypothetical protein